MFYVAFELIFFSVNSMIDNIDDIICHASYIEVSIIFVSDLVLKMCQEIHLDDEVRLKEKPDIIPELQNYKHSFIIKRLNIMHTRLTNR